MRGAGRGGVGLPGHDAARYLVLQVTVLLVLTCRSRIGILRNGILESNEAKSNYEFSPYVLIPFWDFHGI
jgi:hypothetical protein